jgi:hypothetical protein
MLGAVPHADGTVELTVWAPSAATLEVHAATGAHSLERGADGLYTGRFPGRAGDQYLLAIDRGDLRGPVSTSSRTRRSPFR